MFLDSDLDDESPKKQTKKSALESFMGVSPPSLSESNPKKKQKQKPKSDLEDLSGVDHVGNDIMESCFSLMTPKAKPKMYTPLTTATFFSGSTGVAATIPPKPQQSLSLPIPRKPGEDREICVARFGKIYKRKAPSSIGHLVKPCPPGYRFCKFCMETLPLSAFYANVKRYVCKRHHYLRVRNTLKEKNMHKKGKFFYKAMWDRLADYRFQFGYDKLRYDASDMEDLIIKSQVPMIISPMVIPIDPQLPMRPRNVAVVSSRAFQFALKLFGFTCSRALFVAFVQKSNLLPPNFDVARPDDPYHDPTYIRRDYDLPKLFEEEGLSQKILENEDRTIIEEFEKNDDVPWINREPFSENVGGDNKKADLSGSVVAADNVTHPAI